MPHSFFVGPGFLATLHAIAAKERAAPIERFFADLTADVIRAGSFGSVPELVRSIEAYLDDRNQNPRPYTWKADGATILAKIKRARAATKRQGEPDWMQQLRRQTVNRVPVTEGGSIVTRRLAIAETLHGEQPRITGLTLSFECVLHESPEGVRLQLVRRRFWQRRSRQRIEIRLTDSEPIVTQVLIGGQLLRTVVGRPQFQERRHETHA